VLYKLRAVGLVREIIFPNNETPEYFLIEVTIFLDRLNQVKSENCAVPNQVETYTISLQH
jgi:hypothetical protein